MAYEIEVFRYYHHSCHTSTYIRAYKSHELGIWKPELGEKMKHSSLNLFDLPDYIHAIWVKLCVISFQHN